MFENSIRKNNRNANFIEFRVIVAIYFQSVPIYFVLIRMLKPGPDLPWWGPLCHVDVEAPCKQKSCSVIPGKFFGIQNCCS